MRTPPPSGAQLSTRHGWSGTIHSVRAPNRHRHGTLTFFAPSAGGPAAVPIDGRNEAAQAARLGGGRFARRFEGGLEVGLVGYFLDVLDVNDLVILVEHKDRAREQVQLLDERAVFLPELGRTPIADGGDLVDAGRATPARLRERQVHRDG